VRERYSLTQPLDEPHPCPRGWRPDRDRRARRMVFPPPQPRHV